MCLQIEDIVARGFAQDGRPLQDDPAALAMYRKFIQYHQWCAYNLPWGHMSEEHEQCSLQWLHDSRENSTYDMLVDEDSEALIAAGPDATPEQVQTARQARLKEICHFAIKCRDIILANRE